MKELAWGNVGGVSSRSYVCGYCGEAVASEKGWHAQGHVPGQGHKTMGWIYVCHLCTRPTFFDGFEGVKQTPGIVFGQPVADIPDADTEALYSEARRCTGAGCYTAAVLSCRKLLMHVAVSLGAKPGDTFLAYVQFLADNHYVTPGAKGWVDHIRTKGNEATHEIKLMSKDDAEELLSFVQMLLTVIYEFPASVQRKLGPKPKP
jgi:hypothetical protein